MVNAGKFRNSNMGQLKVEENCALMGFTQRVVAIPYWRFRTTYRSHLKRSRIYFRFLILLHGL